MSETKKAPIAILLLMSLALSGCRKPPIVPPKAEVKQAAFTDGFYLDTVMRSTYGVSVFFKANTREHYMLGNGADIEISFPPNTVLPSGWIPGASFDMTLTPLEANSHDAQ